MNSFPAIISSSPHWMLQRIQDQLHTSQDYIQYIEPAAKLVMDIRRKQEQWDKEHKVRWKSSATFTSSCCLNVLLSLLRMELAVT